MDEGVKQARHRASWVTPFTGRPRFTAFRRCCRFYKLKVCGNPAPSKSPGASFPTAFASFVFLCPVVVILTVFQIFHYYYIWWSAISNLWCYYCKFFVLYYSFLETLTIFYFWLCRVFVAYAWASSRCSEQGPPSSFSVRASHGGGFPWCGAQALRHERGPQ